MGRHKTSVPSLLFYEDGTPQADYLIIPQTSVIDFIFRVLLLGKEVKTMPDRGKATSKRYKVGFIEEASRAKIAVSSNSEDFSIVLTKPELLKSMQTRTAMVFLLLMHVANKYLATKSYRLKSHKITFPLSDLVGIGLFSKANIRHKKDGSLTGIDLCLETLKSIQVKGSRATGEGKSLSQNWEYIVEDWKITNGVCTVAFGKKLNWKFIAEYFTRIPFRAFSLSNRGFAMVWTVFYIARQTVKDINFRDTGRFVVSMIALQSRMALPMASKQLQRDVLSPIDKAVSEVETMVETNEDPVGLDLEIRYEWSDKERLKLYREGVNVPYIPSDHTAAENIAHGVLYIALDGECFEYFLNLSRKFGYISQKPKPEEYEAVEGYYE